MTLFEIKLREWGLERFVQQFQDNEIDDESFLLLDDESIKAIILPIGPRLKFKKELELMKIAAVLENDTAMSDTLENSDTDSQSSPSCSSPSCSTPIPSYSTPPSHMKPSPSCSTSKKTKTDYSIRELLDGKSDGKVVLAELEIGLLSYKSRKLVVNTLVSYLIECHGKRASSHVKLAMAKAIIQEFPLLDNEDHDGYMAWFTPGIGNHDASGFLENRIRNVRRRDPDKEARLNHGTAASKFVSTVNLDLTTDELEEGDVAAMITWLKYHNAPKDQVKEMMQKTCKARASTIRTDKEKTVGQLLKDYPRLIDTDGMIAQDFHILFPNMSDALFMKFPKYVPKLVTYADKQIDWKQLLHFSGKLDTDEQISNMMLQVLPLLFPPGVKSKDGKKGQSRATTDEACRSFIQMEKVGTNIPDFLESVKQSQPFVLAMGSREQPEQVFLIVERQTVKCSGLLHAVELCFKLFYILDINYPWECQHTWDFIQKYVYGLGKGKGREKSVPSVTLLGNYLT